jgi:outer membrane protein assembly factor BamB
MSNIAEEVVYTSVRKPFTLQYSGAVGAVTIKVMVLPKNGKLEYFNGTTYVVVAAAGTVVPSTTVYYTSNAGFTGANSFSLNVTDSSTPTPQTKTSSVSFTVRADLYGKDWPMYRQDFRHYGESSNELPSTLYLQWIREYPALQSAWSMEAMNRFDKGYQAVVAGKTLYVGSNRDDTLIALNTDTGVERWRFYADGPIRFAPIAVNGKVYFGSDDGYVYCLNGATGVEIWKFRGGPSSRRSFGNERLISTWPVRGAPVYYNGNIYFASGLWPFEGIFVYALNADTGVVVWKNDGGGELSVAQPHSGHAVSGITPQGQCVIKSTLDRLIIPCGRAAPAFFDLTTGKMDPRWSQGQSRGVSGNSSFIRTTGKPAYTSFFPGVYDTYIPGYSVQVLAGSKTYTTGPGVVGTVHNIFAADDKLFVVTTAGRIYCFGGANISNPPTFPVVNTPLPTAADTWTADVGQMITQVGLGEGSCLVWGIGSGRLVEELAKQSKFKIDVYDPDLSNTKIPPLRQKLFNAGLYGTRVAIHKCLPADIEFAPYAARLIASEDINATGFTSDPNFTAKLYRAIRPYGGTAWLPTSTAQHTSFTTSVNALGSPQAVVSRNGNFSLLTRSGRLPGASDYLHAATGYDKSQDLLAKPPFAAQWYNDKRSFSASYASTYPHPDLVDGYMVSHLGAVMDAYSGHLLTVTRTYSGDKKLQGFSTQTYQTRTNPLNGNVEDRTYFKGYGCADNRMLGDILTFRSGNAAIYHVPSESGPINISGMRSGCSTPSIIPGNGVLIAGSSTSCYCDYPIRTLVGMVHRPEGQMFTGWLDRSQEPVEEDPIRKVGINFGAPGDRMGDDKTLWVHKPALINNTVFIPSQIEPAAMVEAYAHHGESFIKGGSSKPWIAASGIKGVNSIKVNLGYPNVTALGGTPAAIDGVLNDSCWNGASVVEIFNPLYRTALNAKVQGKVQLRYDAANLYVAFDYFGSNPTSLYKVAAWDIWLTDKLNFKKKYVHYRVDATGVAYDALKTYPASGDVKEDDTWSDAGWQKSHTTTATNFIVEMKIPWATLSGVGIDKNSLAVNIQGPKFAGNEDQLSLRNIIQNGDLYEWSPSVPQINCTRFCALGLGAAVGDLGVNRTYTVRMHFAEPDNLIAGQRVFDIALQGLTVASNFDIVAQAGGAQKSIVKEFTNVQIKDILSVTFTPKTGAPVISGLEAFESGPVTPDTTLPSVPTGLTASATSATQVNLSWTASSDNVGVTGYRIYRGGVDVGVSSSTSYSDTGLTAATAYSYKVVAYDAAGNTSGQSTAANATTPPLSLDADGDGMLDTWEVAQLGSTSALPGADLDGDGLTNLQEFSTGTNPTSRASRFEVTSETHSPASFSISWQSVPGKRYDILASADCVSWSVVGNVDATTMSSSWVDSLTSESKRFYRIRLP